MLSELSHFVAIERLGPRVTERIHWRGWPNEPMIALTFDDGPHPIYTPQLLEILDRHQAQATFFLVGQNIENNLDLAHEVAVSHEVANHTFTHPLMWRLSDQEMVVEINRTDQLLRRLNGVQPRFLRPPMGLFSRRVLDIVEQTGYQTVVGDVYPRDPHGPEKEKLVGRVLSRVRSGSIIIMHDGGNSEAVDRSQTVAAVDELIPKLRDRGFQLVTLSRLLA